MYVKLIKKLRPEGLGMQQKGRLLNGQEAEVQPPQNCTDHAQTRVVVMTMWEAEAE